MKNSFQMFAAEGTNIHFNLATEAYLMEKHQSGFTTLFLWQNSPTVVIGRYQNPFLECDLNAMKSDNVILARRFSGGGAVYHDMGNLCFTFISDRKLYDKNWNFQVIIAALKRLGIKSQQSGRNDLLADGFKISGNAFQLTADRACHHGTLLVNCDMTRLPRYLTPDKKKLEAHGVRSVSSRVANIASINPDITVESLKSAIVDEFKTQTGADCMLCTLDKQTMLKQPSFISVYEKLSSDDWNLGKTPRFKDLLSGRNSYGGLTFQLDVDKAVITSAFVFTDCLQTEEVENLKTILVGLPYDPKAIRLRAENDTDPFIKEALLLLSDLIAKDSE